MKLFLSTMAIFFCSFMFAKVHTTQKIRFVFNDKRSVDLNLNNDAIWKPKRLNNQLIKDEKNVEIFYYKPSTNYNYTAVEAFRTLANSKNKEEIKLFWKSFFTLKFKESDVNFADVRDSLFDLIDVAGGQDILLSGLIPVTVFKDSVWRLKTIDNVRPLQNGDVQYFIIDNNYDSKTIELFKILVDQKTQKEITAFWESNKNLDEKVKGQLGEIIFYAQAGNVLFDGGYYKIDFTKAGSILGSILISYQEMQFFDVLKRMLGDLTSAVVIPVRLDNLDLSSDDFKYLLEYVKDLVKNKILFNFDGTLKDEETAKKWVQSCTRVYKDKNLNHLQKSIRFAKYLGLNEAGLNALFDLYVQRLLADNFESPQEIMQYLLSDGDLDKMIVQILATNLLRQKFPFTDNKGYALIYKSYENFLVRQDNLSFTWHEYNAYLPPYVFVKQTGVYMPDDYKKSFPMILRKPITNYSDYYDLEMILTNAVAITAQNEVLLLRLDLLGRIFTKSKLSIEADQDSSFILKKLSDTMICLSHKNKITIIEIENITIKSSSTYALTHSNSEEYDIYNLFVLQDVIVASVYKNKNKDKQSFFLFDVTRREFIQDEYKKKNVLNINYAAKSPYFVLIQDNNVCIDTLLIIKARDINKVYSSSTYLDNKQQNIYMHASNGAIYRNPIVPEEIKSIIDTINNTEKVLRGKEKRSSLTLDLLYFIAHKYPDMVEHPENIKKLEHFVSAPMKAAMNPTVWNKVKSSYFSLSDAFKRKLKVGLGLSLAGIVGYFYTKLRSGSADMYAPGSSAAYGKLSVKGAQ